MIRSFAKLARSNSGASAAEFAIVLPIFLLFLFGVIDAGRFMWEYNRIEKATQVGARVAVVTNVLSSGLHDENYLNQTVGGTTITAGSRIPAGALGSLECTSSGCSCETQPCPSDLGTFDSDTFNNALVARMRQVYPGITAEDVQVRYSGSGFGFAGNAASGGGGGGGGTGTGEMEISPLVTVTVAGAKFVPISSFLLASITIPSVSATLTSEDASGVYSN